MPMGQAGGSIKDLETAKEAAVKAEDYAKAQRLKDQIDEMSQASKVAYKPLGAMPAYKGPGCGTVCKFLCCTILLLIVIVAVYALWFGLYFGKQLVEYPEGLAPEMQDSAGSLWTPSNMTLGNMKIPECTPAQSTVDAMADYTRSRSWQLIEYKSRPGSDGQKTVTLYGWWLPADKMSSGHTPARIVLQHGFSSNINSVKVQVPAFLLRSLGFSVVILSFSEHGISEASNHPGMSGLGWDYYLDVLGAWDYVVNDPEGKLGGKMSPTHVGLMGMASGGTSVLTAAGVDKTIPGVWIESAPVFPKMRYKRLVKTYLPSVLRSLTDPMYKLAWYFAKTFYARVDLDNINVMEALERRANTSLPGTRALQLAVTHGSMDYRILIDQSMALVDELEQQNKPNTEFGKLGNDLFDVKEWFSDGPDCDDRPEWQNHVILSLWRPDNYRQRLCDFWSQVFSNSGGPCNLGNLQPIIPPDKNGKKISGVDFDTPT